MIIVIQCAASKRPDAGYLRQQSGQNVLFVADTKCAPIKTDLAYAHPDDLANSGVTWRTELLQYNEKPENNPLGLLPAWLLYTNPTYELLANTFGVQRLFILSAGWGLIAADFLTPAYDITFSPGADAYKRRHKKDRYDDLRMLPEHNNEPIVFFGGKDYISLFCKLTERATGLRHIFYNLAAPPEAPGCILKKFPTTMRTNWHYKCAQEFIKGDIEL